MAGTYLVKSGSEVGHAKFIEGGMVLDKKMQFTPLEKRIPRIVQSASLVFDRKHIPSYTVIAGVDNIG